MEITVGRTAGFCAGVRNSIIKSEEVLINAEGPVYCVGELVHNEHVVKKLRRKGIVFVESLDEVPNNTTMIIRAHGVTKEFYEKARNKSLKIIDLTCPNVLKIHEKAELLEKNENYIVLVGASNHPETIGTLSFCGKKCSVVESMDDISEIIKNIERSGLKKVAVISQTTFSVAKFNKIAELLKEALANYCEIHVDNTICNATEIRQQETIRMSQSVDVMIIIGSKSSSNTNKLFEVAKENCDKTYLIQQFDDLNITLNGSEVVGIMAGASTPKEIIDEVYINLNKLVKR